MWCRCVRNWRNYWPNSSFQCLDLYAEVAGRSVLVGATVPKFAETTLREKLALLWMSLQAVFAVTVSFQTTFRDMLLLAASSKLAIACLKMLAHGDIIWSQGDIRYVRSSWGQTHHQNLVPSFYLKYAVQKVDQDSRATQENHCKWFSWGQKDENASGYKTNTMKKSCYGL